jgi:oxygen-independent coproporphyrinogen-3 oxidase
MAGIYIHIPFCKKICNYCDFYKIQTLEAIPGYLASLKKEIDARRNYLNGEIIETIYFGGGTPSVLKVSEISDILDQIRHTQPVSENCEITLEANPDDLSTRYLEEIRSETGINRISIGIQSFDDVFLRLLNRRHNAQQALESISYAKHAGFENISLDLIYCIPGMKSQDWLKTLEIAFRAGIKHISAYHLTIEPSTPLAAMRDKGAIETVDEEESVLQFGILSEQARLYDFVHYEISNLAKEGFLSVHNSNYWKQKKYLGLGPSAHSYNLVSRQWNIPDTFGYMRAIDNGTFSFNVEDTDLVKRFNEYIMVSLRTIWGANLEYMANEFGKVLTGKFVERIGEFVKSGHVVLADEKCTMTSEGWLISDFIISRLMTRDEDIRKPC